MALLRYVLICLVCVFALTGIFVAIMVFWFRAADRFTDRLWRRKDREHGRK